MWFLEKIAIISLAQLIMVQHIQAKPHTFLNDNQAKENNEQTKNYLTSLQGASNFKNSNINSDSTFKASRDIGQTVASTPRQQFHYQDANNQSPQNKCMPNASNIKLSSGPKPARNGTFYNLQRNVKPVKRNADKSMVSSLPIEFTSDYGFKNAGNFPEVEYPLSAKETWKPNYWGVPSDFKDLNTLLAQNTQFTHNLTNIYPTRNFEICGKSGKYQLFSTKSSSNTIKNKELLKQIKEYKARKKQNNSTCQKDYNTVTKKNTDDINTLPIEETVQELYTTVIPYYFTPTDITDQEELNIFNKTNQQNIYSPIHNDFIQQILKTDNYFTNDKTLNSEEKDIIQNNNERKDITSNNHKINFDLYDIIDVRKPETNLCDEDYTTDVYSEDKDSGWFSQPTSTPTPFSADLGWTGCKTLTPCDFQVDELEDYYITV